MALLNRQRPGGAAQPSTMPASAALPITDSAPRRRRRPALVAVGVAMAAVCGLGAFAAVNQAGARTRVIAVKNTIAAGKVITADDLIAASVVADPALHPVPVTRSHDIIGQVAAADLPAGTLITDSSVRRGKPLAAGKDTVGVLAKPGQLPAGTLQPGDSVALVSTPRPEDDKAPAAPATIRATVVRVAAPDSTGARVVDLALSPVDSPTVAAWASTGRIAIVLKAAEN